MTTLVLYNHMPQIEQALLAASRPVIVAMTSEHARLRAGAVAGRLPYQVVTVSSWQALDEIDSIAHQLRGTLTSVATRWEGALVAAGLVRDVLGLPGQSMREAIGYTDKAVMKQRLQRAGIPVAAHRVVRTPQEVSDVAGQVGGFPVVVKPLRGFASTNTYVIESAKDLAEYAADGLFDTPVPASPFYRGDPAFDGLAKQRNFLVEEFVDIAEEYHCDGLWVNSEVFYQFPGIYHTPPLRGMGGMLGSALLDTNSLTARIVIDLSVRAARALGVGSGFTHAEIYHTGDGRWLLGEIAARPGGGGIQHAIGLAHGVNIPALHAAVAVGDPVEITLRTRAGTVGWAGPPVPPGRVVEVAAREKIIGHPGVLDATVAVSVGQMGGRTGSGLWGGLAGYVYLQGSSPAEVLDMMAGATARYAIRVEHPEAPARPT